MAVDSVFEQAYRQRDGNRFSLPVGISRAFLGLEEDANDEAMIRENLRRMEMSMQLGTRSSLVSESGHSFTDSFYGSSRNNSAQGHTSDFFRDLKAEEQFDMSVGRPKRLHVSNIPFKYREEDLKEMFEEFGPVVQAEIIFNDRGSKGFGFVTMASESDANEAKMRLHHTVKNNRQIEVNDATPKPCSVRQYLRSLSADMTGLQSPSPADLEYAAEHVFSGMHQNGVGQRSSLGASQWRSRSTSEADESGFLPARDGCNPEMPRNPYRQYALEMQREQLTNREQMALDFGSLQMGQTSRTGAGRNPLAAWTSGTHSVPGRSAGASGRVSHDTRGTLGSGWDLPVMDSWFAARP